MCCKSNINSDLAQAPNKKFWELCSGLFCIPTRCPNHPQNSASLDTGCSQGWYRWILGLITLSGGPENPTRESRENSLEPGSHFHSTESDINTVHHRQGFWAGSRHGCFPRERPGVNSSAWPPSSASLSGDQSAADSLLQVWKVGSTLETRYHLSLENQGTQTPHHLLHLKPKSYRPGNLEPWKSIIFLSNPT